MAKKIHTEIVKVRDLVPGDTIMVLQNGKDVPMKVDRVELIPKEQRERCLSKVAARRVHVIDKAGNACIHRADQVNPDMQVWRVCSPEAAARFETNERILGARIGVRTVLSRCETDIVQWEELMSRSLMPTAEGDALMSEYLHEYHQIFKQLEALDARMTRDAGRNDKRKPVSKHGQRR